MTLQPDAIQRRPGALEAFDQLEEEVAPVAFLAVVVFKAVLVEHQAGAGSNRSGFHQRPPDVIGPESLEEHAATQPVHAIPCLNRLVDDIPLRDGVAIARHQRREMPADQSPVTMLAQALVDPGRRAAVPKQRMAAHGLAMLRRKPDQAVNVSQRPSAGGRFDGIPFQVNLRSDYGALAQDSRAQSGFGLQLRQSDCRSEDPATTRCHRR